MARRDSFEIKMACMYSLRIVASLMLFVSMTFLTFPRGQIPASEFLTYAPVLFALCLSLPGRARVSKQEYRPLTQSRSRLLEIERFRQVSLHLANVAYNSRALLSTVRRIGLTSDVCVTIVCNGVLNVLLANAGDSGIRFDK